MTSGDWYSLGVALFLFLICISFEMLLVNDNDGDYRKRAAQLNAGEEPMGRPGIWPLMVLEKGL